MKASLAAIETRVDQAVATSGATLTIHEATQAFDALRDTLGRIGDQLHGLESGAAKTSSGVETILAASEGRPLPVTAGDLADGFEAMKASLAAIETRVDQAVATSGATLTVHEATQAFDALRDTLGRIGDQLHGLESGAAKTSRTVDAVLATSEGRPLPVTAGDLADGFEAMKASLVAIETRVDQAVATSGATLTVHEATQAFDALRDTLGRIGDQLHGLESDAAKTSSGVETILAASEGRPLPVTAGDLADGFEAMKASLAAIETRVDQAVATSGATLTVHEATQAFDALRDTLGRIGDQLHGLESGSVKTSSGVETILAVTEGRPLPVTAGDLADGFEAMKASLAAIETRGRPGGGDIGRDPEDRSGDAGVRCLG